MAEAKQQQVLDLEQELKTLREELVASQAQEPPQRPHTQPSTGDKTSGAQHEALERQLVEKNLRIAELETAVEAMKKGLATWTAQRDELKVQDWNVLTYFTKLHFLFCFLSKKA